MTKKYYFIVYECTTIYNNVCGLNAQRIDIQNDQALTDIHPIQYQANCNEKYGKWDNNRKEHYMVLNWIEISKKEYDEYYDQI